jgi:hypothetical protein
MHPDCGPRGGSHHADAKKGKAAIAGGFSKIRSGT